MNIAIIAPPFLNIPPTGQGGTENVLYYKVKELVRRGHKVTLYFAGKAEIAGIFKKRIFTQAINEMKVDLKSQEASRKLRLEMTYFTLVANDLIRNEGAYDAVFNHTRGEVAFAPLTNFLKTPIVSVFHLPILPENIQALKENPRAYAISISNNQRKNYKNCPNLIATVYDGVDPSDFPFNPASKRDFLFWIGTVAEHKNPLDAILAAKLAGYPLYLAGKIRDVAYYEEKIKPEIDGKKIIYLGEIGFKEKLYYFEHALALLFPTLWQEPFGMVMIEALACGAPVIAYPNGAVPEVIDDGRVGFIVHNYKQMAKAILKVASIKREDCRRHIEDHFSSKVMVDSYLAAIAPILR